jgi:hypothetical protein
MYHPAACDALGITTGLWTLACTLVHRSGSIVARRTGHVPFRPTRYDPGFGTH